MKHLLLFIAIFFSTTWPGTYALEIVKVSVDVDDGNYRVFGQSRIEAPPEYVFSVLMDYDNFHKLAGGIAETSFLPTDESGNTLVYTRFESCVLFFCKNLEKIERIDSRLHASIRAQVIPERSDFLFSTAHWTITAIEDATLLTYEAEFKPDFWIPPVIGPWAVRRKLFQTAELIGTRIEWMHSRGLTLSQVSE